MIFSVTQLPLRCRARWTETQWDNVWPRTADFSFDLDNTAVLVSADGNMATVVTPWTSTGFQPDGSSFDRPGWATLILARQAEGRWLGIHSHMSLQRGVPQDSHGKRPVKAR